MLSKLQTHIISLTANIAVIIVIFKLIDILNKKIIEKIKNQESNSPLLRFLPIIMKFAKVIIIFVAIAQIIQAQGYSMSSILAGFGIGGLAVGMAAKDTIANVFGSITILSDRVFRIGDYVKVNGIEGYVEDVSIRSTKIRDLDNFLINIPNNIVANSIVTNVSQAKKRLLKVTFGVTYSTSNELIQKAIDILKEIGTGHKEINNDFTIAVHDMGDSSINIRFMGYIKSGSYFKFLRVRGEFLQKVITAYRKEGIVFAFPSRSIYIESDAAKVEN